MITALYWGLLMICLAGLMFLIGVVIGKKSANTLDFDEEARQHRHYEWLIQKEVEKWFM